MLSVNIPPDFQTRQSPVVIAARGSWPDAKPEDYIFPAEKLAFKGKGAPEKGIMTAYAADSGKPLGAWK